MAPTLRFGIDLGGTKIELIALDAGGREILRRRVPTPQDDYLATIAAVAALVHQAEAELGQAGSIGIGTPGAISPASGRMNRVQSVRFCCRRGRCLNVEWGPRCKISGYSNLRWNRHGRTFEMGQHPAP